MAVAYIVTRSTAGNTNTKADANATCMGIRKQRGEVSKSTGP